MSELSVMEAALLVWQRIGVQG